jgi:hypothetical protein
MVNRRDQRRTECRGPSIVVIVGRWNSSGSGACGLGQRCLDEESVDEATSVVYAQLSDGLSPDHRESTHASGKLTHPPESPMSRTAVIGLHVHDDGLAVIRFTSSGADWADGHRIRVNCVVPHWIGLDRARHEFEQLTDQEKQDSGGLVEPELVADTVVTLALDAESVGRIVVIRADREPYDVDPRSADPHEQRPAR